jgi:hypothetical protein
MSISIHNKLRDGHYHTKLPYGDRGSAERTAYNTEQTRREAEFRADLIEEHGTEVLPPEVENALFAKAWEDGHSAGYGEVAGHYDELATLVLLAFNAGIKQGK